MSNFRAVHRRDIIKDVRAKWLHQYKNYADTHRFPLTTGGRTVGEINAALARLDLETCSSADIDAAIGTTGWASNACDECETDCATLVRIGDEPGYEERWQDLCQTCLIAASDFLTKVETKP